MIRISSIFCGKHQRSSTRPNLHQTDLAQHEITLGELDKEVLGAQCIVELHLQVFNLDFCVGELYQGLLVLACVYVNIVAAV